MQCRQAISNLFHFFSFDSAVLVTDDSFFPSVSDWYHSHKTFPFFIAAMWHSPSFPYLFPSEKEDEWLDEKRIYRTAYMFSTTMPTAVERLARKYLRNPVVVTIGNAGKATDLVTQHVIMVKESEKNV